MPMLREADLHRHGDTEVLQELVLHKLHEFCIAQATQLLFEHGQRNNRLRHGAMAAGTAKRPKGLSCQFADTFSMRIVTQ